MLANRQVFRPFIYYKSADILLTTKEAYKWFYDNHLDIMGVVFMAVLMQSSKYLVYRENLVTQLLEISQEAQDEDIQVVQQTGFLTAVGLNNIYKNASLKAESFTSTKTHRSALPNQGRVSSKVRKVSEAILQLIKSKYPSTSPSQ